MKAVLGIGTNIGDRSQNIRNALRILDSIEEVSVTRVSSVYETAPWGYTEQRSFYNIVAEVETAYPPGELLAVCLGIEIGMGRVREFKNGPRIIDIDLLVYEGFVSNTEYLTVPHPRIGERDFVLVPLKELYEDMSVLGVLYKKEYSDIVKSSTAKKIEKI